jgi:hypothetical protein
METVKKALNTLHIGSGGETAAPPKEPTKQQLEGNVASDSSYRSLLNKIYRAERGIYESTAGTSICVLR